MAAQQMHRSRQADASRIMSMRDHALPMWRMERAMKMTTMTVCRDGIARRRLQCEFVARGLASRDDARRTGEYVDAADFQAELARMLKAARATKAVE
ncbi:prevent-host-death protein [Burkholderia pyrrocinia]|uniref:prevent-host-death protein n=1 Tax=Burkholderia pyrrocinia TaxID=60550 RepID=UPI002445C020|nr:prevent-host-death protein [Burkholderia pyrrocinia]